MMRIIRWEDPPARTVAVRPDTTDPTVWTAVAAELRAQPGRWAVVWEGPDGVAANQVARRLGQLVAEPMRAFEMIVDALRDNPGRWAVVVENKSPGSAGGLAHRIRQGVGPFAPLGAFESKVIGPAGGSSSKVYARYVGDGDGA